MRNSIEEIRQLGWDGTLFRAAWELKMRSGLMEWLERGAPENGAAGHAIQLKSLSFADPATIEAAMRDRIPAANFARLQTIADEAMTGRIFCFGRFTADYGNPIDWQLNPVTGKKWEGGVHWSKAMLNAGEPGDIKMTWEAARFPQAYHMARAATYSPKLGKKLAQALIGQIESFVDANPFGSGIHWSSGQEIALRLLAWSFALHVFARLEVLPDGAAALFHRAAIEGAAHIERHFDFARKTVPNNHLISEAAGLYVLGRLLPESADSKRWITLGRKTLIEQAALQIYRDGAYIQNSHNYHRGVMQLFLFAWSFRDIEDAEAREVWRDAMERSLDFLIAHQNPSDGRLPNYGFNDGSMPALLSTCDFSDYRPILQALSLAVRGERIYDTGPWDEEAAWLLGAPALEAPIRKVTFKSTGFPFSGYYTLRGNNPENFAAFRCGSLIDRFSQIDMLHLDVWWRGLNVLADGGSYLYGGPEEWHAHFVRTESHNTVRIDEADQMLHYRRFKCLYLTEAKLHAFENHDTRSYCEGEHYGYRSRPGRCVHRRSVLFVKDDLWIVTDRVSGEGRHTMRLHWLCGEFPYTYEAGAGLLLLNTTAGAFSIGVLDESGHPVPGDAVAGGERPPRGWASRYYGEKIPAPSLAIERTGDLPMTVVSLLCAGRPITTVSGKQWSVQAENTFAYFDLAEGRIQVNRRTN